MDLTHSKREYKIQDLSQMTSPSISSKALLLLYFQRDQKTTKGAKPKNVQIGATLKGITK